MRELGDRLHERFLEGCIGSDVEVLVERSVDGESEGRVRNGAVARLAGSDAGVDRLVRVSVVSHDNGRLLCTPA
jgi:tRNA A37 methylthiotransferase MiaB